MSSYKNQKEKRIIVYHSYYFKAFFIF